MSSFVVIGGGLAGATAAVELRAQGFDGDIHLFGAEAYQPYLRPPLTKGYLLEQETRDSIFVRPTQWYDEHGVELVVGARVARLLDHAVQLESGQEVPFDRALVATGARSRTLELPGSDASGIHRLRTVDESETLRAALRDGGRRVVLVGAGWIGLELAAAARTYGNEVTVVAPGAVPLGSAIGDELGLVFRRLHEEHGVEFRMDTSVVGFEALDGAVTGVVTERGSIPADLVVVAIGAIPNTELAEQAGLVVDNGIVVDEHLATSATDVFAAGDVANVFDPVIGRLMRSEHWANAKAGGKIAARSMLGQDAVLDAIPYFYTDQYDLGMEYSGYPPLAQDATVVYRGDPATREFVAFWMDGSRVVAGMNVNVWDVNEAVQELIRSRRSVDVARLADPAIELADV